MLGPKLHLHGNRRPSHSFYGCNGFDELAGAYRLFEIDAIHGRRNDRFAAGAHGRNRCDHIHHCQRFAAEERAVLICFVRKHHFGASFDDSLDVVHTT